MFKSIKKLVHKARNSKKSASRPKVAAQLALETLGARITPATFMVTNLNASGAGSLINEVRHAEKDDSGTPEVITFAPALAGHAITPGATVTLDDRTEPIEIEAPTGGMVIRGGSSHEVFAVTAGTTATISGIRIAHGLSDDGGGIDNHGNLTLESCEVRGNVSRSHGGGIENEVGSNLTLTDTRIDANVAPTGGGIDNHGSLSLGGNCAVDDNHASVGNGGGIKNEVEGEIEMEDTCTVNGNTAVGYGGGIYDLGAVTGGVGVEDNHGGRGGSGGDDLYETHGGGSGSGGQGSGGQGSGGQGSGGQGSGGQGGDDGGNDNGNDNGDDNGHHS